MSFDTFRGVNFKGGLVLSIVPGTVRLFDNETTLSVLFNRSPLSPQEGQEGARPLWTPSPFVKEGRPRDRGCSNGVVL